MQNTEDGKSTPTSNFAQTPAEYVKERNQALLNFEDFLLFAKKYQTNRLIPTRAVAEIAFHQLRTAALSLPDPIRLESYRWLKARGFHSWDDGELREHDK